MEFGEWLFVNEYPVADALDQVAALCKHFWFVFADKVVNIL